MARRTLKPVLPPDSLPTSYQKKLRKLVREMRSDTEAEIIEAYKKALSRTVQDAAATPFSWIDDLLKAQVKKWSRSFASLAKTIAGQVFRSASEANRRDLKKAMKNAGFTVEFTPSGKERRLLRDSIARNVRLIKSIPSQHHNKVRQLVETALDRGKDLGYLRKELTHRFGVTERRADFIARDQTAKAFEDLSRVRMESVGVTHAVWMHRSGSKEPRPTHKGVMNRKVFPLKEGLFDPAIGKKTFPGQEPNCRCTQRFVLDPSKIKEDGN